MQKSDRISLEACVYRRQSRQRFTNSGKIDYTAAKSMVRYTGHFLINCLLEGDLNGPPSVAKLKTWHRDHRITALNIASPTQTNKHLFFFFKLFYAGDAESHRGSAMFPRAKYSVLQPIEGQSSHPLTGS